MPAHVGDVALGDRHLVEAADAGRHDPRVAEDGDLRVRRLGPHGLQRLHQRRVGGGADGVLEGRAVLVLAGAALAGRRQAGGAAVDDRVDEDAAVVAADGHGDQLGVGLHGVELRGHPGLLRLVVVLGLRGTAGHVGELGAGRPGDDVRVVADRPQASGRRGRVGREHARGRAVGVAERHVPGRRGRRGRGRAQQQEGQGGQDTSSETSHGLLRCSRGTVNRDNDRAVPGVTGIRPGASLRPAWRRAAAAGRARPARPPCAPTPRPGSGRR